MAGRISGRIKRAIYSSLSLLVVAAVLATSNSYIQRRDRQIAGGPKGPEQEAFFVNAVSRPDIVAFYKRFTPSEKLRVANNLRRYHRPEIIRLAAQWLSDFDPYARTALAAVISDLTPEFPEVTAEMLGHTGGFQKVAVFAALHQWQDKTIPLVIDQLGIPERRGNSVEFLGSVGQKAGPALTAKLTDGDREVSLAAADALGKIGYRPAAPRIRALLGRTRGDERSKYLAALASLGDAASESIFSVALANAAMGSADRATALIGLARIRTGTAINDLAREASRAPADRVQVLESLSLAGDQALNSSLSASDKLVVAAGIKSRRADEIISAGLSNRETRDQAAEIAVGRPRLASKVADILIQNSTKLTGSTVERLVRALSSTAEGRRAFDQGQLGARHRGFMLREFERSH